MTGHEPPGLPPGIREGHSPGDGEPAVVRADEDVSPSVKTWRRIPEPRNSILRVFGDRVSSRLLASLDDPAFVGSMRTRMLTVRAPTLGDWPWLRRLMRIGGNRTRMVAYDVKRLLQIAGRTPPEELSDRDHVTVTYDQLRRMVEAAEAALSRTAEHSS